MIQLPSKYDCCGCEACAQACPRQCIRMMEDAEGFLYPAVDESSCIGCNICNKVCPCANRQEKAAPLKVLAAKTSSEEDLLRSSSGGLFVAMARKVLAEGGVVFGAAFSPDFSEVSHLAVESVEELLPLLGSKYLQSRIGAAFRQARAFLDEGRTVLFCGTSCQVKALLRFLGKPFEKLYTADLICHGVPSPKVWRKYLAETLPGGTRAVSFRDKRTGWDHFSFTLTGSPVAGEAPVEITRPNAEDPYMWLFMNDYLLRPSCFACPAKGGECHSDFTIGDYWGIETAHPDFFDRKGVGVLFVHSARGLDFLSGTGLVTRESTLEQAIAENPTYHSPKKEPAARAQFFRRFNAGGSSLARLSRVFRRKAAWAGVPAYVKRKIRAVRKRLS